MVSLKLVAVLLSPYRSTGSLQSIGLLRWRLSRIAGDQDDGVRESVHAIVTAVETMHSEMQRQGVDGEDYKRRAVDVVVQLIETESSRPRLGDLSTPAYAQLSFELESLMCDTYLLSHFLRE